MESKRKEIKWFKNLITPKIRKNVRTKIRNMFDYEYDIQWNIITAQLKTIWILALMYAIGVATKRMAQTGMVGFSQKKLFSDKVKSNLKQFNKKRFAEFTRMKGLH